MKVQNAVIMAAGASSRFAPLSYETHKALTVVKGEVMIERQIQQLQEANVPEIFVVTGYKAEQFSSLADKYGVKLVPNPDYLTRNNSIPGRPQPAQSGNDHLHPGGFDFRDPGCRGL